MLPFQGDVRLKCWQGVWESAGGTLPSWALARPQRGANATTGLVTPALAHWKDSSWTPVIPLNLHLGDGAVTKAQ